MGISKKNLEDGEGNKWVFARVEFQAPLNPVTTKAAKETESDVDESETEACLATPRGRESKIPEEFSCPPAPRKSRPLMIEHYNGQFFVPDEDLNSIFKPRF